VWQAREAERQRHLAEERERAAQEAVSDTLVFVTELIGLANTELSNLPGGTRARLALARQGLERVAMLADRPELADRIDTSLGYARQRVGEAETVAGRPLEALAAYGASLVDRERAVERVGGTFERRTMGVAHWRMAEVRLALGELSAAEAHAREALGRMQALDAEGVLPPPIDHNVYLGMSHQVLADVLAAEGRGEEGLAELAQALRLMDEGLAEIPGYVPMERIRAQVLIGRGEVLLRAGRLDEALVELERALLALAEQAGRAGVANAWERTKEAQALLARAAAFAALGRWQDAADDARRAAELAAALADADPDDFESRVLLGRSQSDAGALLARLGRRDEAIATLSDAAALLERLARQSPRHALVRREQARAAVRQAGLIGPADAGPALAGARELVAALADDGLLLPIDGDLRPLLGIPGDD
jgi:tetratricopeptide (TPR) repeat protein